MKKLFLFAIIALLFTSCANTTYEVSFVDMKNSSDTLHTKVTISERFNFAGEDTHFDVDGRNTGTIDYPVLTYTLKVKNNNSRVYRIYSSSYPIILTGFKVLDIKR